MSRPTDPPRAEGAWDLPWATVAALVGAALYARTVGYGWVFDDQMDVVLNAYVQSWQHVGSLLTTTVWTGSGMETGLWRPVTSLSFLVNHSLSGLAPWSFHLVNLVLHAGVAALVVQLGRTWGLPAAAAGIGGILFAVHPAFVEVVAPASGRKDLLAALFVLLFLLAHDRARKEGGAWVFAAVGALAGAALSKESGFMALPLLAATEAIRSRSALAPFRDPYALADDRWEGVSFEYVVIWTLGRLRVQGQLTQEQERQFLESLAWVTWRARARAALATGLPVELGLLDRRLTVKELWGERLFPGQVAMPARWAAYYWRKVRTTVLGERQRGPELRYAF